MGGDSDLFKTEFNLDVDVPIRPSRGEWGGVTSPLEGCVYTASKMPLIDHWKWIWKEMEEKPTCKKNMSKEIELVFLFISPY